VQTQIEETSNGTKKKILKTKKHMPPNFQAIKYLIHIEKGASTTEEGLDELPKTKIETFNTESF